MAFSTLVAPPRRDKTRAKVPYPLRGTKRLLGVPTGSPSRRGAGIRRLPVTDWKASTEKEVEGSFQFYCFMAMTIPKITTKQTVNKANVTKYSMCFSLKKAMIT